MKLSRVLSLLFQDETFDIELSKMYEGKTRESNITISIDPVDYLFMSVNKSGWNSCHSMHKGNAHSGRTFGQFASGTLSYMCDPSTLIAFKTSDNIYKYQINNFEIKEHSKSWRQVIYYDYLTHAFVCSKQYPYFDDQVAGIVRTMLEEQLCQNCEGLENKWKICKNENHICNTQKDMSSFHYNDITHRNGARAIMAYPTEVQEHLISMDVGSEPKCPICGQKTVNEEDRPYCKDCYYKL